MTNYHSNYYSANIFRQLLLSQEYTMNQPTIINDQAIVRKIAQVQALASQEADMINRWYHLRRDNLMDELNRLDKAYNERMAKNTVRWAEYLTKLYMEQEMHRIDIEEGGMALQNNVQPMPVFERQTNIIFPQEPGDIAVEQPFVPSILGVNTLAIVSDDDDDDLLLQAPFHNPFDADQMEMAQPDENLEDELSFDNKLSPDNPRTPTLVPSSGVLTEAMEIA